MTVPPMNDFDNYKLGGSQVSELWMNGVLVWPPAGSGWYQIGLDAHAYVNGFDGTMILDPASEVGATGGIYVKPGTLDLVHLPAGTSVDFAQCFAEWPLPFPSQPYTFGLAIYDTSMTVLVDDFYTETTNGIAGGISALEPPDTPYVMPVAGWIGMRLANNSGATFNQYDYTVAPTTYLLYLEYS